MVTDNVQVGFLKDSKFIFLLPVVFELVYFSLSLTAAPPLLMAVVALPALFVIPGLMLLVVLKGRTENAVKLVVEGFFVSTVLLVVFTSSILAFNLPPVSSIYSLVTLPFVLFLCLIALGRKIEFKPTQHGTLLIALAFCSYVALLIYFGGFPRLFTPDETGYIFSARMGILEGIVPPMGVRPNTTEIGALLQGRYFWIYLLTSFIGSTGLPAHQAGLLGVSFLTMIALASSLLVETKWLRLAVFALVTINPLLFSFSALTLNDLAVSFYLVFAVVFFVKSFSSVANSISVNIASLLYSILGMVVVTLIKPNLLVFVAMLIILVYIIFRYKLYKQNLKYKILSVALIVPILVYEFCVDIPYVISVWILRNIGLGNLFGRFLFLSPAEKFAGMFVAPWWNVNAPTLFTRSFADCMEYFYTLLMPETSTILISAIVLVLPIFMLSRRMRKELDRSVLASLVLLSLCLFYVDVLSSAILSDVSRYSLWMIPLWIPLALMTLHDIANRSSFRTRAKLIFPVFAGALVILLINVGLSREKGGVFVGYGLPSRLWTADALILQLLAVAVILGLLFLRPDLTNVKSAIGKRLSFVKTVGLKNTIFSMIIILILLNGICFSSQLMDKSNLYKDHGLDEISNSVNALTDDEGLIFANNYIQMRPYMSDELLKQGLLLPPPDTKEEFLRLLELSPNNTTFLISDDAATTWYEYANNYIKSYEYSDTITPENIKATQLPKLNLTDPLLNMTFDEANETTVVDQSGFGNDGINKGAKPVEGYYGNALQFDGNEYVSIPNNEALTVQDELTISFLAVIGKAEPLNGYMILSKGYASVNGSFDVFVFDRKIYFELGQVGWVSIPAEPYVGSWHNFIFSYNGEKMGILVDGSSVISKPANGLIGATLYDLEIGRDSERQAYYFVGIIDQLQISNKTLTNREVVKSYYPYYALRISGLSLPTGQCGFFSVVGNEDVEHNITVEGSRVSIDENRTATLEVQIESPVSQNVTILLATDRFTKVYPRSLDSGLNLVTLQSDYVDIPGWYEAGGFYWLHLSQARLIVIDGFDVSYSEFLTPQNLKLMNVLLLTVSLGILAAYAVISYWKKAESGNHAQ